MKQILLNGARDNPLTALVSFPHVLGRWDEAVLTLKDSRRTGAVKVLLEPAR
ncbi:MAG TPA: hypothetical protein VHY31_17610 [Streptosporangiaceae bacterium]|nr:hypothetical protein [Streptosporangiaceae bacterium]